MAIWMTQTQACRGFRVGPKTLERYSRRGLLPLRRSPTGPVLYDGEFVARLFRPRTGDAVGPILGEACVGDHPLDLGGVGSVAA